MGLIIGKINGPRRKNAFCNIVVLFSTFLSLYLMVYVFLTYRQPEYIDELGLFNPIYMFLHTGRMTYPIHGEFDRFTIFIRPCIILRFAVLMKLGVKQDMPMLP